MFSPALVMGQAPCGPSAAGRRGEDAVLPVEAALLGPGLPFPQGQAGKGLDWQHFKACQVRVTVAQVWWEAQEAIALPGLCHCRGTGQTHKSYYCGRKAPPDPCGDLASPSSFPSLWRWDPGIGEFLSPGSFCSSSPCPWGLREAVAL